MSKLRYAKYRGDIDQEALARAREGDLFKIGDTVLVWVNEGDLCEVGEEMDIPLSREQRMVNALKWVSENPGAHPANIKSVVDAALRASSP